MSAALLKCRNQVFGVPGLRKEAVEAHPVDRLECELEIGMPGDQDPHDVGPPLAHLLEELDSVEPRHLKISDHGSVALGLHHLKTLLTTLGDIELEVATPQSPLGSPKNHRVVIDEENISRVVLRFHDTSLIDRTGRGLKWSSRL